MLQIRCQNLSLGYDRIPVSEPVSFEVKEGDYLCIVGENGSGKTTLMKTLLHLMEPISGEILWGDGVTKNQIGYLPQQAETKKDFPATVWEIVTSGCVGRGKSGLFLGREDKLLARRQMERLEISHLEKKSYRTLSGGQQRRVLLARALCAAEKILLLDEPVAALDPHATEELYRTIEKLNRESGVTILMITHDLSAVSRYASSVLHMGDTPLFYPTLSKYLENRGVGGKEGTHE
ncbi:MAG: ATP-binding cassette domain-containing protein [Clostridia bacterium]|nr:ATP-binding cassette domain-containing protein [Clostridia bacterium]